MGEDDTIDNMFDEPNGPAYLKKEIRSGPPLSYIAEKMKLSLIMLHNAISSIRESVPEELPQPPAMKGSSYSVKEEALLSPAQSAFRNELTAYLALINMLALANDQDIFGRLLGYSYEGFRDWLDRIERESSITG